MHPDLQGEAHHAAGATWLLRPGMLGAMSGLVALLMHMFFEIVLPLIQTGDLAIKSHFPHIGGTCRTHKDAKSQLAVGLWVM